MTDLSDRIETVAGQPQAVSGDAGSMKNPDLDDLIKADRYLAEKATATGAKVGIRLSKLVPPGAS